MSNPVSAPPQDPTGQVVDEARAAADAAASQAGVLVRELRRLAEIRQASSLTREVWRAPENPPVTTEFLRALTHSGNYVSGAFFGDELVGACVGFFASPADRSMHSHITGVAQRMIGRHVGFALKVHQRAWALAHSVTAISWTFDPLVCRNAYFNIGKLAATPLEYLPDFYGPMSDGINAGDDSDRVLVRWALDSDGAARACQGNPAAADAARLREAGTKLTLDAGDDGLPVTAGDDGLPVTAGDDGLPVTAGDDGAGSMRIALVRVPPDIETMRRENDALARQWRRAVRRALGGLITDGGRVTGFDRSGWYVVQCGHPAEEAHHGTTGKENA